MIQKLVSLDKFQKIMRRPKKKSRKHEILFNKSLKHIQRVWTIKLQSLERDFENEKSERKGKFEW